MYIYDAKMNKFDPIFKQVSRILRKVTLSDRCSGFTAESNALTLNMINEFHLTTKF